MRLGRGRPELPPCLAAKEWTQTSLFSSEDGWDLCGRVSLSSVPRVGSRRGGWPAPGRQQRYKGEVLSSKVTLSFMSTCSHHRACWGEGTPSPWYCSHPRETEGTKEGMQDPSSIPLHLSGRLSPRKGSAPPGGRHKHMLEGQRFLPGLMPSSLASCHRVPEDNQSQEGIRCYRGWQMLPRAKGLNCCLGRGNR